MILMTHSFLSNPTRRPVWLAVVLSLGLSGCGVLPRASGVPEAGGAAVPAQWRHADADADADADAVAGPAVATGVSLSLDDAWWKAFGDAQLDALMQQVLEGNTDLSVALLRARQAALRADQARGNLFPTLSGRVGQTFSRPVGEGSPTTLSSQGGVSATWEADLWGRLGSLDDAARLEAQASDFDRRATALSLAATTATLYWRLAYLDQRMVSARSSLDHARQTQQLIDLQYRAGAVSGLEVAQARANVANQEAAVALLAQTQEDNRQALALLLDAPTQATTLPARPVFPAQPWPRVKPDLGADVLARRSDLKASEARLRKAFANLDASRAALYPSLTLNGGVSGTGTNLGNVLADPLGALGFQLNLPFLQWNELQRNVGVSRAEADIAVLNFRQTLYQALSDVDRSLSAQRQYGLQVAALEERLKQAATVERLFEVRYRAGAEPLKSWLDAQESRRQAELALLDARNTQLANWVALVLALGGGAPAVP